MASVLIIDDEQEICELVVDVLQGEGLDAYKADNGPDGLELVEKHKPDVVLLDMKLQVNMDGVEVLRRIKKCHPAAAVVVITGYIEEKMEQEARDLGIEGYIEKPFTPTQLLTAIETIVKRKKR